MASIGALTTFAFSIFYTDIQKEHHNSFCKFQLSDKQGLRFYVLYDYTYGIEMLICESFLISIRVIFSPHQLHIYSEHRFHTSCGTRSDQCNSVTLLPAWVFLDGHVAPGSHVSTWEYRLPESRWSALPHPGLMFCIPIYFKTSWGDLAGGKQTLWWSKGSGSRDWNNTCCLSTWKFL